MSVAVLLLAAGGSTRMRGGDKLLETLGGEPLLRRGARRALASRARETVVVTGAHRAAREAALAGLPVRIVHNAHWREGMGTSIAAGVAALAPNPRAVLVMPADMPGIDTPLLDRLIDALPPGSPRCILRPRTATGAPGHPVLFGAAHLPALAASGGDEGARAVLAANRDGLRYLDVAGEEAATDLDTPEAWAAYRAARRDDTGV